VRVADGDSNAETLEDGDGCADVDGVDDGLPDGVEDCVAVPLADTLPLPEAVLVTVAVGGSDWLPLGRAEGLRDDVGVTVGLTVLDAVTDDVSVALMVPVPEPVDEAAAVWEGDVVAAALRLADGVCSAELVDVGVAAAE